jgi:hypothetical protein
MLISFRDRPTDPAAAVSAYVEAVSVFPARLIEQAVWEFIRGQVRDRNHAFAPSAAEICALVQEMIAAEASAPDPSLPTDAYLRAKYTRMIEEEKRNDLQARMDAEAEDGESDRIRVLSQSDGVH